MIRVLVYLSLFLLSACSQGIWYLFSKPYKSEYTDEDLKMTTSSWVFLQYEDSMEVEIIDYYSALTSCRRHVENALAIVLIDSDTVRIIDMCPGPEAYNYGDTLVFLPDLEPRTDHSPSLIYINNGPNPSLFAYPEIKKTTFGYLRRKE